MVIEYLLAHRLKTYRFTYLGSHTSGVGVYVKLFGIHNVTWGNKNLL